MKYSKYLIPLFVFILALGTRLYSLPERHIFSADEEYQATYARTIVEDFHPVWIGVSAGDTGFYLGPYFTYFTSLWLYISSGDPLITAYVAVALSSLTAVLLYYLSSLVHSPKAGIIASLIYSFSPLLVYHDQRYWNPSPSTFLSVLLMLALIKLKDSSWWLLIVAFCLGAFWHVHLSLVPLTAVALYALYQERSKLKKRPIVLSLILFVLMLAPLIIFDYYSHGHNIATPIRMIQRGSGGLDLTTHLQSLGETLARFIYLVPGTIPASEIRPGCLGANSTLVHPTLSAIALLLLLLPLGNIYLSFALWILGLSYVLYPGPLTPYYALGLIPLYFLGLARALSRFKLSWLVLAIYIFVSSFTLYSTSNLHGIKHKHDLIKQLESHLAGQSFALVEDGTCLKYGGWRYLFTVYGRYPSVSSTDSSLSWLYQSETQEEYTHLVTVGATNEIAVPSDALAVYQSGGYTAYITYAK